MTQITKIDTDKLDCLVWHTRYSDTDEPDRMGRWARILFFKDILIGWVKRVEAPNSVVIFSAQTYFPVGGNDYPLGLRVYGTFEEAKEFVETEWAKFTKSINVS